jgi:predicted Zn finger-like uncharacterized protein
MNLATRCPSCSSVFRVVDDQLKVHDGWVRCGRCSTRFDARSALFDLDEPPAPPPPHVPARDDAAAAGPPPSPGAAEGPAHDAPPPSATSPKASAPDPHAVLAGTGTDDDHAPDGGADGAARAAADASGSAAAIDATPTPGFVLRAERAQRWRSPRMRRLLGSTALLLALALAAQMALHYRDDVAARWPETRPWLQAACTALGCTVDAPRRIDSLSVESSSFARADGSGPYRLQLVLRNRAPTAVRMPAIELALTDGSGQTLVRRVLTAAELGSGADSIAGGGEVLLQAALDAGARTIVGYSVEPFYP